MTGLDFLSPDLAAPDAVWRSPLERALAHAPAGIEDVSRTGKLEVRGDLTSFDQEGTELVRITAERGFVLCAWELTGEVRKRLEARFPTFDVTAAYAGLRVRGEQILRRVTDLDPERLPAIGALAHVQALVLRDDAETFRVFVPQEYGHYVAEVVLDAARGLEAR